MKVPGREGIWPAWESRARGPRSPPILEPGRPGPPRSTPSRDVGGDREPHGGPPRGGGPRVPSVGPDPAAVRDPRRVHRGVRLGRGPRERLPLAPADPAPPDVVGGRGPVPHVDVHGARPPRGRPWHADRARGNSVVAGTGVRDGPPACLDRGREAVLEGGLRAHPRDASQPSPGPDRPSAEGSEAPGAPTPSSLSGAIPPCGMAGRRQAFLYDLDL